MDITFKERLKKFLTSDEFKIVRTSYDHVGGVAIIDIPEELLSKEKEIAQALIDSIKTIETVLKKTGIHEGEFRTQSLKYLAGVETKEAIYKELGCRIKVNVETVYFSPRLSTERKRIMEQVKSNESILVMFSGCAVYPVVLSKNTKAKKIMGIEINPEGHRYGLENIKLNKIKNVKLINSDVNKINLNEKFDRILMPLPKSAYEFLVNALEVSKNGTIIHFYAFEEEKTMPEKTVKLIDSICEENNVDYEIVDWVKCGNHKPYWYRICVDIRIK